MDLWTIDSAVISGARYNKQNKSLYILFRTGKFYRYMNVPEKVFHDLIEAESKGHFFERNIRDEFEYEQVE